MTISQAREPKRGYLANILTIPPLIYPFQYNPTQIVDSKSIKWKKHNRVPPAPSSGSGFFSTLSAIGTGLSELKTDLAQRLSKADLLELESEGGRSLSFSFVVDGRERRPGEPERRREGGNIVPDLAIIRSFTYPKIVDVLELLAAIGSPQGFTSAFFNAPPTMTLIMGGMSMEGFVTQVKITEEAFNADLEPVRAKIEITMTENINSLTFLIDSFKRIGNTAYHTAYEDFGKVLF